MTIGSTKQPSQTTNSASTQSTRPSGPTGQVTHKDGGTQQVVTPIFQDYGKDTDRAGIRLGKLPVSTVGNVGCFVTSYLSSVSFQTGKQITNDDFTYIAKASVPVTENGKPVTNQDGTPKVTHATAKDTDPDIDGNFTPSVVDSHFGVQTTPAKPVKDDKGNDIPWGYNSTTYTTIKTNLDQGKSVIVQGQKANGFTHYVQVTGYTAPATKASDFTIMDPANSSRTTLENLQESYPRLNQVHTVNRVQAK